MRHHGRTGEYNCSFAVFSKDGNLNNSDSYSNSGQMNIFKTYAFTDYGNSIYQLNRSVVDIDISGANGEDFCLGLHNCDCTVNIYKIWFD